MYVGVTRAKERLFLTYARRRLVMGELRYAQPSRFLAEVPKEHLSGYYSFDRASDRVGFGRSSDEDVETLHRGGSSSGYSRERFSESGESPYKKPGSGKSSTYGRSSRGYDAGGGSYDSSVSAHLRGRTAPRKNGTTRSNELPIVQSRTPAANAALGPQFKVGDRVSHAKFGSGTVSQVLGEGEKAIYSIQFDQIAGKKLLDPKFAKLDKI